MTIAALTAQSPSTLHRLFSAALRFERFSPELLHEKLFENPRPGVDEYTVYGAFDGDDLIGAMQSVARPRDGRAWLGLFAVAERHRRHGVATQLFEAVTAAWRAANIREAEALAIPGNYFVPGLDPRYTPALCLLERFGFSRFKDCVNLIADLGRAAWKAAAPDADRMSAVRPGPRDPFATTDDEQKLAEQGVTIRRATADTDPLLDAFFTEHFGADWRLEVERARRISPPGVHLALADGRVIAFAAHSAMNREWGWFGPMGTAPQAEGRGIGRVLLRRCLADLREAGHATAIIPWVGPIGFYARHVPCRVHRVYWRYKLELT